MSALIPNHLGRPGKGRQWADIPDSCQVAVVVHDVEVRHCAVALLLAGLVLKLLERHTLGEGVNAQHLGGLQGHTAGLANTLLCNRAHFLLLPHHTELSLTQSRPQT